MIDSLHVAWRYVSYYRLRTAILVTCVTLIAALPLSLELLLVESERQFRARAADTPLVIGAKGSLLDLVMNSLYYGDEVPELISMAAVEQITDMGLAVPVPMYVRFKARGFPIVGTTLDYFDFRGLQLAAGRSLVQIGEAVLGAKVAEELGLNPRDSLLSSPETVFDLAGVYPLKMKVVGVLERSYSADDLAVFVDLKTAWVVQGLVHGHAEVTKSSDPTLVMKRDERNVTATAKLVQYTEITEQNIDSFHFHGEPNEYPITAVIALPSDERSGTILRGRYIGENALHQIARPRDVIDGLLENIFRIKNVLDAVILLVGIATALALMLVFALSLRLRQREIDTIFKIGCSRLTIAKLLGAEIAIILLLCAILTAGLLAMVSVYDESLVRALFIR